MHILYKSQKLLLIKLETEILYIIICYLVSVIHYSKSQLKLLKILTNFLLNAFIHINKKAYAILVF